MSSIGNNGLIKNFQFIKLILRYGPGRQSRQQSLVKLGQLQQSIVGWEGKDIVANSSEIVYEGKLKVNFSEGKMHSELNKKIGGH